MTGYAPGSNALGDWIYIKGTPNTEGSIRVRYSQSGDHQAEELIDGLWSRTYGSPGGASTPLTSDSTQTLNDSVVVIDATSGPVEYTFLPAAQWAGKQIIIKKKNETANDITLTPDGSETLDGETSQVLTGLLRPSVRVYSDGTELHFV